MKQTISGLYFLFAMAGVGWGLSELASEHPQETVAIGLIAIVVMLGAIWLKTDFPKN
jgi:hypothetical protein